jgi:hypothetical protein
MVPIHPVVLMKFVLHISLQAANQELLLFGPIENPRWPPAGDII